MEQKRKHTGTSHEEFKPFCWLRKHFLWKVADFTTSASTIIAFFYEATPGISFWYSALRWNSFEFYNVVTMRILRNSIAYVLTRNARCCTILRLCLKFITSMKILMTNSLLSIFNFRDLKSISILNYKTQIEINKL